MPAGAVANEFGRREGLGPGQLWVIGSNVGQGSTFRAITEHIIRGIVEQANVACTTHLTELAQPISGRHLARRIVGVVQHDEVSAWGNIGGSKAERIGGM